jgi:hypothetical protein
VLAGLGGDLERAVPQLGDPLDERLHRQLVARVGPEVPALGVRVRVGGHRLGEHEVARQRVQDVLPGPHGAGIAQLDRPALQRRGEHVGDQAVGAPVASADHVPGAAGRDRQAVRLAVRRGDVLGRRLGRRVRVVAAERVGLGMGRGPRGVALVRRDHDDRLGAAGRAHRVEQRGRPEDVDGERLARRRERAAHERLGGEVEDDLRGRRAHRLGDRTLVAHIAAHVPHGVADLRERVQRG